VSLYDLLQSQRRSLYRNLVLRGRFLAEVILDRAEHVADGRAQQGQDRDHDDRHQHQDQRVLYEALSLFAWVKQHLSLLEFT